MENKILTDPLVKPDSNVLENALGKKYQLYLEFERKVNDRNLTLEWHYYNDGKSWLCKILNKKKNFGWLSAWSTGFKLTFYFTERTLGGVYGLAIDDEIKDCAQKMNPAGKLRPVVLLIKNKKLLNDGLKILEYKMNS